MLKKSNMGMDDDEDDDFDTFASRGTSGTSSDGGGYTDGRESRVSF